MDRAIGRGLIQPRADISLKPTRFEILSLTLLVLYYAAFLGVEDSATADSVNAYGAFALMVILIIGAARMVRLDSMNVWSALFWFRISTAVYFGFGSLVVFVVNDVSRDYIDSLFEFTNAEMIKSNMVFAAGIAVTLSTSYIVTVFSRPLRRQLTSGDSHLGNHIRLERTRRLGLIFLTIGIALKYTIIFPHAMGWTATILPGALNSLGALTFAGIYLLTLWSLSRSRSALILITLFVVIEMFAGLLLLTKEITMLPLLVYLLAILSHRWTIPRVATAAMVMIVLFNFLVPLVSYGRSEYGKLSAGGRVLGISERVDIFTSYFDTTSGTSNALEMQSSLLRFSYTNTAAYAISSYDNGNPGDSLRNVFAAFIPRFLWPDKPILNAGSRFRELLREGGVGSISAGLFAEAYWNFGWFGIALLMVPYGIILTMMSRYALRVAHRGDWVYMPILFILMRVGLASNSHFVATILGSSVIVVGMHVIITVVKRIALSGKPRSGFAR